MNNRKPDLDQILQERVKARLEDLKLTARGASLASGLGADAIRTILNGRSKSPRGETLLSLARVLECSVDYLLGASEYNIEAEKLIEYPSGALTGISRLAVMGVLSMQWRPLNSFNYTLENTKFSDIFSIKEFAPGFQRLEIVMDESANLVCPPGSVAHLRQFAAKSEIDAKDRDLLVFDRFRKNDSGTVEIQRALWMYRRVQGIDFLEAPTTNPRFRHEVQLSDYDWKSGSRRSGTVYEERIEVAAMLLRTVTRYAGPELPAAPDGEFFTHTD